MNFPAFSFIASLTGLAIAPSLVSFSTAQAQASPAPVQGLSGSYLGVAVNADSALGLGQEYLQQTGSSAQWFVNQATVGSQLGSATPNPAQAAELNGRALQGRLDLNHLPISVRGKLSLGNETSVVQPIISYDLAIARNTNLYAGAGYSFVSSKDDHVATTQKAFFVTAGAEAAVSDKVVIYGDAQYPVNPSELKIAAPVNVQFGLGFRF